MLLVGADSYDYRDYLGTDSISFIPTLYGDVGVGQISWSPIDPAFVDIDRDQVPDLALGRFPVATWTSWRAAIAQGDQATRRTATAVFASDTGYGATTDEIAASLPTGYEVTESVARHSPCRDRPIERCSQASTAESV